MGEIEEVKVINELLSKIKDLPKTREISLAITKLEEAILWIERDEQVNG